MCVCVLVVLLLIMLMLTFMFYVDVDALFMVKTGQTFACSGTCIKLSGISVLTVRAGALICWHDTHLVEASRKVPSACDMRDNTSASPSP